MATEDISCKEAKALLTRYNINALLVTENSSNAKGVTGYITRQVIEKALFHHLEAIPIREYMSTEISHVRPDADVVEIQDKIIGKQTTDSAGRGR